MTAWLAAAFLLGAAGSAHCLGMCGPIALAVPSPSNTLRARWMSTLLLNAGRISTYTLLGVAVGSLGLGMRLAGLQQAVSITGGILLLLSTAMPSLLHRWSPTGRVALGIGRLRSALARNLKRTAPEALFLTGALNGLLPCGLLYAALLGAASLAAPTHAALFMAAFGLGTWPALMALRMGGALVSSTARLRLRKLSPVLISAVAMLMILRGMGLGIPYLSPGPVSAQVFTTGCH